MECINIKSEEISFDKSGKQILNKQHDVVKVGFYYRMCDKALIQRYRCRTCRRNFSTETRHPCRYQKKRDVNFSIFKLLNSGVSQRRAAKLLHLNKKTIVRKFVFLGKYSIEQLKNQVHLKGRKITELQFDDMETFEHTKCKPLSIILAVEGKTRFILGYRVAKMPSKGLLVKKSLKKYGKRKDERRKVRLELFKELKGVVAEDAVIKSDMNPHYTKDVRKVFSTQEYLVYKGRRGCVVGQGELKAGGYDPLFSLNHTAAMLRANLNRLFRRTWCTTKKAICLDYHIALYCFYHNFFLLKNTST